MCGCDGGVAVVKRVCVAARWCGGCGGEGVYGCNGGAVVVVKRVCVAVMVVWLLWWRGRSVNGWRGGGGRKLRVDWSQMKSCKGSCLYKSKSCIFE